MKTFEQFLKEKHSETYMGTDDEINNKFELWLSELQVDNLLVYADDFINSIRQKDREELIEKIKNYYKTNTNDVFMDNIFRTIINELKQIISNHYKE